MRNYFFILILLFLMPLGAHAALININTADAALLDTLPGIGATYAERIIEYRITNGPFAKIEDIQNVKGIGPATFADMKSLITVGTTDVLPTEATGGAPSSEPNNTTAAPTTSAGSKKQSSAMSVAIEADSHALINAPLEFFARVKTTGGTENSSLRVSWGFGDGSWAEGERVEKTYRSAGTYLVVVEAFEEKIVSRDELIVTVQPAQVRIFSISTEGITISNDSNERLDLSGWALFVGQKSFRIPRGTVLLQNAKILFPFSVTRLSVTYTAWLAYPEGGIASIYPAPTPNIVAVQPSASVTRSNDKQSVDVTAPASITNVSEPVHAVEAVNAPSTTTQLAALGAVVPTKIAPETSVLRSPWVLGFLGILVVAGGALLIL